MQGETKIKTKRPDKKLLSLIKTK